jgi:circadian clock protein KaiB
MKNQKSNPDNYILKLYITGASANSILAVNNIKHICDKYLIDRYELQVIDIYQEPELASDNQVIALPLLIRSAPLPLKRLIGNMSDTEKVLKGLELTIS